MSEPVIYYFTGVNKLNQHFYFYQSLVSVLYSAVRSQTSVLKRDLGLTTEAGALKENIKKNRYKDILPYDQSRVVLSLLTTDSDDDYINASFIKGALADRRYIASQGPLSSTVIDFWRMIWQHDVKVIVMACREVEMGKKKCECYWSPVHQSAAFGPFTVYTQGETHPNEDLVVRALTVSYQQVTRSLVQYQFLSWPDHDVPYEAAGVLDLLERARNSQGTHTSPMLIHCSAGCGRTGVICALDYIRDLLVTKQLTGDFSIMKIVLELRRQRPSAVQTKVCEAQQSQLTDMSDTYAVVNKSKQTVPASHHYDNDSGGAPIYSTVKPRIKASAPPIYDIAAPTNQRQGEGPLALSNNGEYQLLPGNTKRLSQTDDDYEDFSSSVTDMTNLCSPGGIGFNCRIQKPRGPRDPPAEWSRLER
uniref:protein-tyrosine-phosphatase n=1 Tax=Sparus aurata TaxID=8175 RepID=A0A671TI92_SPAAU